MAAAKARFEESLGIDGKLAHDNSTAAEAQRNVGFSLNQRFEEILGIDDKLARGNSTSAAVQRDVSVSLNQLGAVAVAGGDLMGAKARFERILGMRR